MLGAVVHHCAHEGIDVAAGGERARIPTPKRGAYRERQPNGGYIFCPMIDPKPKPKPVLQVVREPFRVLSLPVLYFSTCGCAESAQHGVGAQGMQGSYPQQQRQYGSRAVVSAGTLNVQTTRGNSRRTEEQWDPDTQRRWFRRVPPHHAVPISKNSLAAAHSVCPKTQNSTSRHAVSPPAS